MKFYRNVCGSIACKTFLFVYLFITLCLSVIKLFNITILYSRTSYTCTVQLVTLCLSVCLSRSVESLSVQSRSLSAVEYTADVNYESSDTDLEKTPSVDSSLAAAVAGEKVPSFLIITRLFSLT